MKTIKENVNVSFDKEVKLRLRILALQRETSISSIIKLAVKEYLERNMLDESNTTSS